MDKKAVVLLSGGQDSATCLAMAQASGRFKKIYAVNFDYGQRHWIEMACAQALARLAGCEYQRIPFPTLSEIDGYSTMISRQNETSPDVSAPHPIHKHLPSTFLPGRNYLLLGLAAAFAFNVGASVIFTGTCQTDYSGYPDCREEAIDAIAKALRIAMDFPVVINTPLMHLTKAETVWMMQSLGKLDWYAHTHTCYKGERPPCEECPACVLRAKGFAEAGIHDPLMDVGITG